MCNYPSNYELRIILTTTVNLTSWAIKKCYLFNHNDYMFTPTLINTFLVLLYELQEISSIYNFRIVFTQYKE